MALSQITEQEEGPKKKSALEKFAMGLDIAKSVGSLALAGKDLAGGAKVGQAAATTSQTESPLQKYHIMKMKKNPFDVEGL